VISHDTQMTNLYKINILVNYLDEPILKIVEPAWKETILCRNASSSRVYRVLIRELIKIHKYTNQNTLYYFRNKISEKCFILRYIILHTKYLIQNKYIQDLPPLTNLFKILSSFIEISLYLFIYAKPKRRFSEVEFIK